jgi:porin
MNASRENEVHTSFDHASPAAGQRRRINRRARWLKAGILWAAVILAMSGTLGAQAEGPWWTWSTIDGNWGGYRNKLADMGFTFSGTAVVDLQDNVSGGKASAFAPAESSLLAADADLEKLAGFEGLLFHAEFLTNAGENLSTKSIDNILQVATVYSPQGYYLGQVYAKQKLFGDTLTLQAGRMATANNFASLPVFNDYVSYAPNPIPINLSNDVVYFTELPSLEWGAVGTVAPTDSIAFAAGVYESNLPSAVPYASRHGVDFSFSGSGGTMEVGQLSYSLNSGQDETGLPGTYYLGGFYSGADYQVLSGEGTRKGNYGFYFEAQQMIYRHGGAGSDSGLTPWFSVSFKPRQSINQLPVLAMAGAVYQDVIPGPECGDDTAAFGFYNGTISNELPSITGEKVLELNYTCWATPWLGVTPDLQYVLNPSGGSSSANAPVIGIEFQFLF